MKPVYIVLAFAGLMAPMDVLKVEAQSLFPIQNQAQSVTIGGEILRPGNYPLPANATLSSLLDLAGGPTEKAGLDEVLVRRGKAISIVDVPRSVEQAKTNAFLLRHGDEVTVPVVKRQVHVMGAVKHPGSYFVPIGRSLSVAEVLALAGGVSTPDKIELTQYSKRLPSQIAGQPTPSRFTKNVKLDQLLEIGDALIVRAVKKPLKWHNPLLWLLSPNPAT